MKRALILGVGGQDGSYLADLLLEEGCEVHGLHRRSSVDNLQRIAHLKGKIKLHQGDVTDFTSLLRLFNEHEFHEVYNMADQDNVDWSHATPQVSVDVTFKGVLNVLEAVRESPFPEARIFQPVSATMFGDAPAPQNEDTPLDPRSPYAVAKAAAFHLCRHHRRDHGMWIACGIMYNHDSPRRGSGYLLHKIADGAARIARGEQEFLELSHLDQEVDVGHAREFMRAAIRMLDHPKPDDFVAATGKTSRIRDLALTALEHFGLKKDRLREVPFHRPGPAPTLVGKIDKVRQALAWNPCRHAPEVLQELLLQQRLRAQP